ncbi:MAG: hypothetical protein WDO16_04445 [Bacteroidota bacterium]
MAEIYHGVFRRLSSGQGQVQEIPDNIFRFGTGFSKIIVYDGPVEMVLERDPHTMLY